MIRELRREGPVSAAQERAEQEEDRREWLKTATPAERRQAQLIRKREAEVAKRAGEWLKRRGSRKFKTRRRR